MRSELLEPNKKTGCLFSIPFLFHQYLRQVYFFSFFISHAMF